MGIVIAVANQKGGVGKTTTAVNLAACLGEMGHRTLLADIDPQGNSTSGLGIEKRAIQVSSYDVLMRDTPAADCVLPTQAANTDILPAHMGLAGAEIELGGMEDRESRLKKGLASVRNDYDYIIIDCPPSLGLITLNALNSADQVLVPIQCEYYALEGLSQLTNTIRQVRRLWNPDLELLGVLLTMYDGRLNLTTQVVAEVKRFFPDKIFRSVIPRNVRLSEAPSFGMAITDYDKNSKGAQSYRALAAEVAELNKNRKGKKNG